jgi:hypothetical protein
VSAAVVRVWKRETALTTSLGCVVISLCSVTSKDSLFGTSELDSLEVEWSGLGGSSLSSVISSDGLSGLGPSATVVAAALSSDSLSVLGKPVTLVIVRERVSALDKFV